MRPFESITPSFLRPVTNSLGLTKDGIRTKLGFEEHSFQPPVSGRVNSIAPEHIATSPDFNTKIKSALKSFNMHEENSQNTEESTQPNMVRNLTPPDEKAAAVYALIQPRKTEYVEPLMGAHPAQRQPRRVSEEPTKYNTISSLPTNIHYLLEKVSGEFKKLVSTDPKHYDMNEVQEKGPGAVQVATVQTTSKDIG
jgi:hypothetical protein